MLAVKELKTRAEQAGEFISSCRLCPRSCGIDRTSGEVGFCGIPFRAVVSSYGPHFGEEPPLVGQRGSGTVFFAGCNLGCIFCQNYDISHHREGVEVDAAELAGIFLKMQKRGCHNLNLVTPTHVIVAILNALSLAVQQGFGLPVVYNCGGYESRDVLSILDGVVDIYMPDVKYSDDLVATKLSGVGDYWAVVKAALKEMHRQVGDLNADDDGVATRGLLVRHLVLPHNLAGTEKVVEFIAEEISPNTYINIMDQYRPCFRASQEPKMTRPISRAEYLEALRLARAAGLRRGF